MKSQLERLIQLALSPGVRDRSCRRPLCRRYRHCVPPRDRDQPAVFRCPYQPYPAWYRRLAAVQKMVERIMKAGDAANVALGLPPRFAPSPPLDHLDLSKPLDIKALFAEADAAEDP